LLRFALVTLLAAACIVGMALTFQEPTTGSSILGLVGFAAAVYGIGYTVQVYGYLFFFTQRYPNSANAWDSLGEGYATKGDKKNAIINYEKALALNPTLTSLKTTINKFKNEQ